MNIPDYVQSVASSLTFTQDDAKVLLLSMLGCALILVSFTTWHKLGKPRLEAFMSARQGERDTMQLMVQHAVGAWEFAVKEGEIKASDMWKAVQKFDHIPGMRIATRDMLKKHLPAEEVPATKTKLSVLSQAS